MKKKKCTYCKSLSGTGMHKIQNLGSYVLTPKDLEDKRVNGLLSLEANTWFGVMALPHFKIASSYLCNGSIKICV